MAVQQGTPEPLPMATTPPSRPLPVTNYGCLLQMHLNSPTPTAHNVSFIDYAHHTG